jgi:SAM-dependent methyltransferase
MIVSLQRPPVVRVNLKTDMIHRFVYKIYRIAGGHFRRKRQRWFTSEFRDCRTVVDIGGTTQMWQGVNFVEHVTLLNVEDPPKQLPDGFTYIQGDGRDTRLPDSGFDLAFSNSVIEHVGNFDNQRRFANELLRVGRRIYCQTPNRWFPIEPHFLVLGVHWLPRKWFTHFVHRYLTLNGWTYKPDPETSAAMISAIRLLTRRELLELFPGCKMKTEWCMGLPKSFVVWK